MHNLPGSWDWCSAPSAGLSLGQGPGPWLLLGLGLKKSWYLGAEHQLGLRRLQTERGKTDHLKLLRSPTVMYYPTWPAVAAEEAGSAHPCSTPEMERQPEQEMRQRKAPYVTRLP